MKQKKSNNLYPVYANAKWGAIDENGTQAIPIIYETATDGGKYIQDPLIHLSDHNNFIVVKNKKYGVLDIDSCSEIISTVYDDILWCGEYSFCVLYNRTWYFWEKGALFLIGEYDSIACINEDYIGIEKKKDTSRDEYKAPEKLDYVYSIIEKKIIPRTEVHLFYEDLAITSVNKKYGFINRSLEVVIPIIYDFVENFDNGYAYAEIGSTNYYLNTQGEQVVSEVFKYKYKDTLGNQVKSDIEYSENIGGAEPNNQDELEDDYNGLYIFMEGIWNGFACYKKNGLIGIKGLNNRIVTPAIFDFVSLSNIDSNNKYISVVKEGKEGLINIKGVTIIPCEYDYLNYVVGINDLFVVGFEKLGELNYGIIDLNNNYIVSPIHKDIYLINNTLAMIMTEDESRGMRSQRGVLNIQTQQFVIPPIYDTCWDVGGLFFVEKDDKWGYLDQNGEEVLKVEQPGRYIYGDFSYTHIDGGWGWIKDLNYIPDYSKHNPKKEVYFENWKPIIKNEDVPF